MIAARGVMAVIMIGLGATILFRLMAFGLRLETVSGMVLGAALVALGVHRLALIARLRGSR
ncbi:MAG: hypothetical protein JO199_03950 [Candidatus Eremiobacteraeota bacterium]|nr:hypothetical protein [Candidatus Eremiobacteraeota bacterium]